MRSSQEIQTQIDKIDKTIEAIPKKMDKYENVIYVGLVASKTTLEWVLGKRHTIDLLVHEDHPLFRYQRGLE